MDETLARMRREYEARGLSKADLLAADEVAGIAISVDTKDGRVTLNGTVKSQAEADAAIARAKAIEGVKEVTSNLKVEPERR